MARVDHVFFVLVDGCRVGNAYTSRSVAKSWEDFARQANGGRRSTVEHCPLHWTADGELTAETLQRLDERYNLDPPSLAQIARLRGTETS